MALKGKSSYIHIYVNDTRARTGVVGLSRSSGFSSIKLRQNGVLTSDLRSSISSYFNQLGSGNYSFSASTSQMNYDVIQCIRIPSNSAYMAYSPVIYTQGGYLDTTVSSRSNFNSLIDSVSVSANNDKTGYSVSTVLDKTGYSITANSDKTNYSITGNVTVGTNLDKRNYGLSGDGSFASVTARVILDKTGYLTDVNPQSFSSVTASIVLDKSNYGLSANQLSSVTRTSITDKTGYSILGLNSVTAAVVLDKTGYSSTVVIDPNSFSSVTAAVVLDKTNYSLSGVKKTLDNLRDLSLTSTVDGMTLDYVFQLAAAMVNGNFSISSNQITFYKRDNSTPLTVITKTNTSRNRNS